MIPIKNKLHLTQSEEDLMELFWKQNKPLTSVQILELAQDRSWNGNYLHVMLRSLLKNKMIQVCGTQQYGNQYARQFIPSITKEEYGARLITSKGLADSVAKVTVALANETTNYDKDKLISQLESIIDELKSSK